MIEDGDLYAPSDARLFGRDVVLRQLQSLVEIVSGGKSRGCMIAAESGMGKSVLLRQAMTLSAAAGLPTAKLRSPGAAALFETTESLEGAGVGAVLLIDDFHLSPPDASDGVIAAVRRVEVPLGIVIALRPYEEGDTLPPSSSGDLWFDHVKLEPLSVESLADLASAHLGAPLLPSSVVTLHQATGGNPLHSLETLREALAEGWLSKRSGHWTMESSFRPRSMVEHAGSRVGRMGQDELRVLSVLAILARSSDLSEVAAITPDPSVVDATARLIDEGLVIAEGAPAMRCRIARPLYAEAVLSTIGPVRQGAIREAAFNVLRSRGASAQELARHAIAALEAPPDLPTLIEAAAAEAEEQGDASGAAAWFQHLSVVTSGGDKAKAVAGAARTTAQIDPARAIDMYVDAIERAPSHQQSRLRSERARALQRVGRFEEALVELERARTDADADQIFSIDAGIATVHLLTGRRDEAMKRMQVLAREAENTPNSARALYHLAAAHSYAGDVAAFIRYSQQSAELAAEPHLARSARSNVAWGLILQGRFQEAETLIDRCLEEFTGKAEDGGLFALLNNAAILRAWKGDTVAALDLSVRMEALAERIGNPTDRLKTKEAIVLAMLEGGDPSTAATMAAELEAEVTGVQEAREINFTWLVLGETMLAIGDLRHAALCSDRAESLLESDSLLWAEGTTRLLAQILLAQGDPTEALKACDPWLDEPGPVAIEHAALLEVAGRAAAAAGERAAGYRRVSEAHDRYEWMGATRRAGNTRGWLLVNEPRRAGRPRSFLPAGLTQRELEIMSLLVRGKTNREIAEQLVVSPATVKTHVERILSKTGAARRSELSVVAVRLGLRFEGT